MQKRSLPCPPLLLETRAGECWCGDGKQWHGRCGAVWCLNHDTTYVPPHFFLGHAGLCCLLSGAVPGPQRSDQRAEYLCDRVSWSDDMEMGCALEFFSHTHTLETTHKRASTPPSPEMWSITSLSSLPWPSRRV